MNKFFLSIFLLTFSFSTYAYKNQPLVATFNANGKAYEAIFAEISTDNLYMSECINAGEATYYFKDRSISHNLMIEKIGAFKLERIDLLPNTGTWCDINHFRDGWATLFYRNIFSEQEIEIKYYIRPVNYGIARLAQIIIDGDTYLLTIKEATGGISK